MLSKSILQNCCTIDNSYFIKLWLPNLWRYGPVEVPKNGPPMFNVVASDDFLFKGQFGVIDSWFKAGIPVEFHFFKMVVMVLDWVILIELAIDGLKHLCIGWKSMGLHQKRIKEDNHFSILGEEHFQKWIRYYSNL